MSRFRDLLEKLPGRAPKNAKRSPKWRKTQDAFLKGKRCAVCGGKMSMTAHHKIPFSIAPELELIEDNLLPLCEAERYGIDCHLLVGHLGNFRRYNPTVVADAIWWHERIIGSR